MIGAQTPGTMVALPATSQVASESDIPKGQECQPNDGWLAVRPTATACHRLTKPLHHRQDVLFQDEVGRTSGRDRPFSSYAIVLRVRGSLQAGDLFEGRSLNCHASWLDRSHPFYNSGNVKPKQALSAFGALSQETRLEIFRQLVRLAPTSIPAGDLAGDLDVPPSTLSSHLAILQRARLIKSERQGRTILYSADLSGTRDLVEFLVKDCCRGHPERCDQLVKAALPSCC